ncbi:MAG: tRNA uridine-5-carboxymethylaminomethyl(34) synthesis enzyme MnmG [Clostridiales bacterium]|nr:tRNA uridine-5-carboxymethylaminomethyl(34) synthesis enzyme MnmG [Clostridiales bacterium]
MNGLPPLAPQQYRAGQYDVIVVGAGHAGCEAALAAARLNARTLLITMSPEATALAPCNPAIGGPAKSVLVREIDALGGAMARITDAAQIQVRRLNTGKGPAVQALRAQIDKALYQRLMRCCLEKQEGLDLRQGEVSGLLLADDGTVAGCATTSGAAFAAPNIVVCSGTYLNGRVIIGEAAYPSGPLGYPPALPLGASLRELGLPMRRFKTGTPARLDSRSIDFDQTVCQPGERGLYFSYLTREGEFDRPSMPCWLTYTNSRTHDIIRANLHRAPLYSGVIEGVGPRYCPSIEDKVVRFAQRDSHQMFLEPEGEGGREYYVQGMSSSLPEEVQVEFLRSIKGLTRAVLIRPAYAIEYDCIDPLQLKPTLEHKGIGGLFMAGQINGTSGYEEAAGQGLLAGANAAAKALGLEPLLFSRDEAYLGVLVDDLVTKGTEEPYRLFTSRAEYRLLLRQDNADLRLCERGYKAGLVDKDRWEVFCAKQEQLKQETARLNACHPKQAELVAWGIEPLRELTLVTLLKRPEFTYERIAEIFPPPVPVSSQVAEQVEISIKYEGYIAKQREQVQRFKRLEEKLLPADIDYNEVYGLSSEGLQKLCRLRPVSIGQAGRISGVSPADINVLLIYLEKKR